MNNLICKVIKYIALIPGGIAVYLLLGTILAFILYFFKATVTSDSLIGNIFLFFLFPTKLINTIYSNFVPLNGTLSLASWFISLLGLLAFSVYLFKKISNFLYQ